MARPTHNNHQVVESEIAKHRSRAFRAGMILSNAWIASAYWTFQGLMMSAQETATASFTGSIQALIASVVSAVVVAGCCALLLGFSAQGKIMNKQTKKVLVLGTALVPFVLCISTFMAVKGLSVSSAHYYEMEDRASQWQIYAASNLSDPSAAQAVIDTLAPLRDSVCHIAGLEESDGIVSGSPGKGALSAALTSACLSVSSIAKTLEDTRARTEERQAKVAALLQELQGIPEEKNIPIFERRDLFRDQVGLLRQEHSGNSSEDLHEKVGAQIAVLRASVITLETKDGKFGERQRAAIASLKSQLANVESIVNGFLANTEHESLGKPAELASSGAAIGRWWPRLIPQILLALSVDLSILWMAGFLAVSRARLRSLEIRL